MKNNCCFLTFFRSQHSSLDKLLTFKFRIRLEKIKVTPLSPQIIISIWVNCYQDNSDSKRGMYDSTYIYWVIYMTIVQSFISFPVHWSIYNNYPSVPEPGIMATSSSHGTIMDNMSQALGVSTSQLSERFTTKPRIYGIESHKFKCFSCRLVVVLAQSLKPLLSRTWQCSESSADKGCSNYIWVINNFIAY